MFTKITMIDFSKPLTLRKRKHTGPYYFEPSPLNAKHNGFGFYQASSGLFMDRAGSTLDLRLEAANDFLDRYSRLRQIRGYYCDEFLVEIMRPIIARLPNKRGFLAGWTMGNGMLASMSRTIWESEHDAAMAAHDEAERAADEEREYQAKQLEEFEQEEASKPDIYVTI